MRGRALAGVKCVGGGAGDGFSFLYLVSYLNANRSVSIVVLVAEKSCVCLVHACLSL
jgi:hypothetical protein